MLLENLRSAGDPPPVPTNIAPVSEAPQPILKDMPPTGIGYTAGTYRTALTLVDGGGRHTKLTPLSSVVSLTANQCLSQPLPSVVSLGTAGIGVWLSRPNTSIMYLQRVVDVTQGIPPTYELTGPFRTEKTAPTVNETYLARPALPTVQVKPASYDLGAGAYYFFVVLTTPNGLSPFSLGVYRPTAGSKQSAYYVTNTARPAGVTGWHLFVTQKDRRTYIVYPEGSAPDKPLPLDKVAEVYSFDPGGWPPTWRVQQRDLPTVNSSGIPDPKNTPVTPGKYSLVGTLPTTPINVAIAFAEGNREGPLGPEATITIPATRLLQVWIPKKVQLRPNAEVGEVASDGFPTLWTLSKTGGDARAEGGELILETSGTQTGATPYAITQARTVDASSPQLFSGEIEVTEHVAGGVEVMVMEYSTANPVYGVTTPVQETLLHRMDGVGEEDYEVEFDSLHSSTVSIIELVRYSGTSKNAKVRHRHGGHHPHRHKPRKWKNRKKGDRGHDDSDVGHEHPHRERPKKGVGRPKKKKKKHRKKKKHPKPSKPRPRPPSTTPPPEPDPTGEPVERPWTFGRILRDWTFDSGLPSATILRTPSDSTTTVSASSVAAIDGSQGLLLKDTGTSSVSTVGIEEAVFDNAYRGGIAAKVKWPSLPGTARKDLLELSSGSSSLCLVSVENNEISVRWRSGSDFFFHECFDVVAGRVYDLDLQISGAGTPDGIVHLWGTDSAGVRELMARFEDLDLQGLPLTHARAFVREYVASDTHETHMDSIKVADAGLKWYRDHNTNGKIIGQSHLFMPKGEPLSQKSFVGGVRQAVKPNQRYAVSCFFHCKGVAQNAYPLSLVFVLRNGETVEAGSILSEAGNPVIGTLEWKEYTREIVVPPDCYEMRIESRDIGEGVYVAQEFALTELYPASPVEVKRTGRRAKSGKFIVPLNTAVPKQEGYPPQLPRTWRRVAADAESIPEGTDLSVYYRSSKDLLSYSDLEQDLSLVPQRTYLLPEITFTGDGVLTPVLSQECPFLEQELIEPTLLREDGSEYTGGVMVSGFPWTDVDSMVDVWRQLDGRHTRLPTGLPVDMLPPFDVDFFSSEGLEEFRRYALRELCVVEGFGLSIKIKILVKPEILPNPYTAKISDDGSFWHVHAIGSVEYSEIIEAKRI